MLQPFAMFGLYFGEHQDIPNSIELDFEQLQFYFDEIDFDALLSPDLDWDYLYQPGDIVEDDFGVEYEIIHLRISPYHDEARDQIQRYYVEAVKTAQTDYLLPEDIRYAVRRDS